jgi:hypothetical protein
MGMNETKMVWQTNARGTPLRDMEKSPPFPARDPNWSQMFRSGSLFCGDIVGLRKLYHPYRYYRFVTAIGRPDLKKR